MKLSTIRDTILRRLNVNYLSYLGEIVQTNTTKKDDWYEGYFQAKRDVEIILKQLETFYPEIWQDEKKD